MIGRGKICFIQHILQYFAISENKEGWYQRHENNGWRLVSDRVMSIYLPIKMKNVGPL